MPRLTLTCLFLLLFGMRGGAQDGSKPGPPFAPYDPESPEGRHESRLPNGKVQEQEILKADHDKSLQDAHQLVELSGALAKEMEQSNANILSLSSLHKAEEIERLAKRIRSRIRHY